MYWLRHCVIVAVGWGNPGTVEYRGAFAVIEGIEGLAPGIMIDCQDKRNKRLIREIYHFNVSF